jgi:hypothetical protein
MPALTATLMRVTLPVAVPRQPRPQERGRNMVEQMKRISVALSPDTADSLAGGGSDRHRCR